MSKTSHPAPFAMHHKEGGKHDEVMHLGKESAALHSHPAFAQLCGRPVPSLDNEAEIARFNQALAAQQIALTLVPQTDELLADQLNYEQRIAEKGQLATRLGSLHDYYNALMWLRFPRTKQAINQLQMQGIRAHGSKIRSRHQQAITHIDEAGAWIAIGDPKLFDLIEQHAWCELFFAQRPAWGCSIEARIFGHALYELLHAPQRLLAAKIIAVQVSADFFSLPEAAKDAFLDPIIAHALMQKTAAADPKLLSTVPVSGIPHWWPEQSLAFYQTAPCFRDKPPGRVYGPMINAFDVLAP